MYVATSYEDENAFLRALGSLPCVTARETFEDSGPWGPTRPPSSAAPISSNGIVWTANLATNSLSTSSGGARTGSFGAYSNPHGITTGNPLAVQNDGFVGTSLTTVYAVGGWVTSNTPGARIELVLDGKVVSFANEQVTSHFKFFGVVDQAGFTSFEFRETEGRVEEQKLIFGDDIVFCRRSGGVPDAGLTSDASIPDALMVDTLAVVDAPPSLGESTPADAFVDRDALVADAVADAVDSD